MTVRIRAPGDILGHNDPLPAFVVGGVIGGVVAPLASRVTPLIVLGGFVYGGVFCAVSILTNQLIGDNLSSSLLSRIIRGFLCVTVGGMVAMASTPLVGITFAAEVIYPMEATLILLAIFKALTQAGTRIL
ncbi:MAG: hypothetical protein ACHQT8_04450 [Chlamydiales bacterium]